MGAVLSSSATERDGHILTGAGMGVSFALGCEMIKALDGEEKAEKIKMSTMVDGK